MEKVLEFYNNYDEDTRLIRHSTEFITTTYFLDDLIHKNHKILDVAAGAGAYALYYAEKGCTVEAMDIVPKHIALLESKITDDMELNANVGNALDLSDYEDESFDVVLNMGPVYHVGMNEIIPCLTESLRVLKSTGILVIAYVNKFQGYLEDKFTNYFNCYSPNEMENFYKLLNVKTLRHIPTDGLPYKGLEEFKASGSPALHHCHLWLEENYLIKDIHSIQERFTHALLIARKNNFNNSRLDLTNTNPRFWKFLNKLTGECAIIIDRPKGWRHPRYKSVVYPVDYGYLQNTKSMDRKGIDVWIGSKSDAGIVGIFCTVDILKKDSEIKIVVDCTEDEIIEIEKMHNSEYMQCLFIKKQLS